MSQIPPPPLNYQSPQLERGDVRGIAFNQKMLLYCLLAEILFFITYSVLAKMAGDTATAAGKPTGESIGLALVALGCLLLSLTASVAAAVFCFRLAIKLWGIGVGIVIGICSLIPCIGLIILLVISQKATGILQKNGIPVGLMGAKTKISEI